MGDGVDLRTLDKHRDDVAGHLVDRMPSRAHRDVECARIDHVMRVVPADRIADLDHRAGAVGLVPGRIGAVVEHAVLDIDQPGEHQLRQDLLAVLLFLHQPEKNAVGVDDLAALDQGQPMVEALGERTGFAQRLLVGPVDDRLGRLGVRHLVAAGRVVAGRFQDLLVPDVQPRGNVPDGLRQRQRRQLFRQHRGQIDRGARRQQAMVVVDEIGKAGIDALMVRHVRIGRMNAHRLRHDFRQRPAAAEQFVIHPAAADLVAGEEPILELTIKTGRFPVVCCGNHSLFAPRSDPPTLTAILGRSRRPQQRRLRIARTRCRGQAVKDRPRGRPSSPPVRCGRQ